MSKYFLVSYKEDYADEFYVSGMRVFTEAEYNTFVDNQRYAKELEEKGEFGTGEWDMIEIYFGTNEYLIFRTVDDIIKALNVREITEQEYNTLKSLELDSFGEPAIFYFFEDVRERNEEI